MPMVSSSLGTCRVCTTNTICPQAAGTARVIKLSQWREQEKLSLHKHFHLAPVGGRRRKHVLNRLATGPRPAALALHIIL